MPCSHFSMPAPQACWQAPTGRATSNGSGCPGWGRVHTESDSSNVELCTVPLVLKNTNQLAHSQVRGSNRKRFSSLFRYLVTLVSVCLLRPRSAHLSAGRARRGAGVYHSRPLSGLPGCRSGRAAWYRGTCPTHSAYTCFSHALLLFPTDGLQPATDLRRRARAHRSA